VDLGYPNRKGYLAPYKGQKYHISEWQNARQPIGSKEVFNYAHSSLHNVIERSFGVLKMKWRILLSLPSFSLKKQSKIIIACITLHNFIRDSALHDRDFDQLGPCWNLPSIARRPTRVNSGDNRVTCSGAIALLI
jgi:hypothetical protein